MDLGLSGKVALVTGGSRGIGRAIAEALRDEGASVAICARAQPALGAAAREMSTASTHVMPVQADVRSRDAVERMVAEVVAAFGRLDVLVNNAGAPGGTATGGLAELSDDDMFVDFDTKFMGYLRCTRAVAPEMKRQSWGRIVNIGGLSGRQAGSYTSAVRNLALSHLTRTAALEVGPFGITVNLIHPGNMEVWADSLERGARREGISVAEVERRKRENAIRRPVAVQEIGAAVAFLASTQAAAITGETFAISGGMGKAVVI